MFQLFATLSAILLFLSVFCYTQADESLPKTFVYLNTLEYNTTYSIELNETVDYILEFNTNDPDGKQTFFPSRISVTSNDSTQEYPLFITATQQKGILSWQLPMIIETAFVTQKFSHMERTLCPRDTSPDDRETYGPVITISTPNSRNITISIKMDKVLDFYVRLNEERSFSITPSKPKYYYYSFNNHNNNSDVTERNATGLKMADRSARYEVVVKATRSVILIIESDDDVCAVVSIQDNSCPTFDNEREILYEGYYLTMMRKGGITLTQSMFPSGFHIVFIVKESDYDCLGKNTLNNITDLNENFEGFAWDEEEVKLTTNNGRVKNIRFKVVETIDYNDYIIGASFALLFFVFFYFAAFAAILIYNRCFAGVSVQDVQVIEDGEGPSGFNNALEALVADETDSDAGSDYSIMSDRNTEKDVYRFPAKLTLDMLAKKGRDVHSAKTQRYLWHLYTVSVFYALPVIQLVITYQGMLNQTGNQDLCYYNFLCAHPLGFLSDFNHVFSNLGYVLLGILFIILVRVRQNRQNRNRQINELGIPQHYGLFYSMGGALIMEGVLSASYHVCPNNMNFQFDSSFMYVIAVLCMIKIYQTRHPDINARAHSTFSVLALIIFIGLMGVLNANMAFWITFTVLHLVACFLITLQIYYMGRFKFDGVLSRAWLEIRRSRSAAVRPNYVARMAMLLLANLANWILAGYGLYMHKKDFAVHLLAILMGNTILYTLFYIAMKLLHRERIKAHAWFFIVSSHAAWFASLHFFLSSRTKWSLTPAQSRRFNRQCDLLEFYDSHDIWHVLSAMALFLSFNLLLTLDDGLSKTPRNQIYVF